MFLAMVNYMWLLSRGVSHVSTKILIKEGELEGEDGNYTKNVVFKEILLTQT